MMNSLISSRKGNAVIISIAITGFLFVAAAGASKVITNSLRDSTKVVDNSKALYSAESALESALYEASGRGSGYTRDEGTQAGDPGFVAMNKINSSSGSWSAGSRTEQDRIANMVEADVPESYRRTLFIPPRRKETKALERFDPENWRRMKMGETVVYNLWVDDSNYQVPVTVGGGSHTVNEPQQLSGNEFYGPNGIKNTDTKSIFGDGSGTNSELEDMYIDLYLPVKEFDASGAFEDKILLSWKIEGITVGSVPNIQKIISMQSLSDCGSSTEKSGVICLSHLRDDNSYPSIDTSFGFGGPLRYNGSTWKPKGKWVRLRNPLGMMQEHDGAGGHIMPVGDFLTRNLTGDITTYDDDDIYFPRLVIQMGPRYKGLRIGGSDFEYMTDAYVRVGFEMNSSVANMGDLIENFPLPDDKVQINATGKAGGIRHGMSAEVQPQELAPMFDYAVFQQ